MDLKDYLRVIRRRGFEFIAVFVVIIGMYMYVAKVEKQNYIASTVVQIGATGFGESAKGKHTYFRNLEDFKALLQQKHGDSIYKNVAQNIRGKMELVNEFVPDLNQETVQAFLNQYDPKKEMFYLVGYQDGLEKTYRRYDNVKDLKKALDYVVSELKVRKDSISSESIQNFLAEVSTGVNLYSSESSDFANSMKLQIQTENEHLSRLIVNEVAFYAMRQFNEQNKKRMKQRASKIDRWWDNPRKRDEVEQLYNGVIAKYREYKTALYRGRQNQARLIEEQFVLQFRDPLRQENVIINSFADAFDSDLVDEMRSAKKDLADEDSRYNNLTTWGINGQANNIVANEDEVSQEIQNLLEQVDDYEREISELEVEKELAQYRFSEVDPKKRELLIKTNDRLRNIQDQIDQEEIALHELESQYTSQHPRVIESQKTIKSLKEFKQRLEEDLQNNDIARFDFRIGEIEAEIRFNNRKISEIESQLETKRKEMQQINDMKLHLSDIEDERKRIFERVNNLKQELSELKRQIDLDKIVDVHQYSKTVGQVKPRYNENTLMITIVVGLIFSIFVVYVREYMDASIKTEHDVRRHMNLPVLSMIGKAKKEVILTELPSKDPFAEHFNTAATLVRSAAQDLGLRSFLITSTVPQEGKTTICVDLAIALARKGLNIIIVDGDLRIPTIHEVLEVDNSTGLSTILEGRTSSEDMSGIDQYLKQSSIENLRVLTSGPIPADPINLLESVRMKALIEELKDKCDYLIMDTPPIYNVGDTLTMAALVDATLFVVGAERVEQDQVTWAKHLLTNVNANILGVFLNMVRVPGKSYYYYYNGYKSYRARG